MTKASVCALNQLPAGISGIVSAARNASRATWKLFSATVLNVTEYGRRISRGGPGRLLPAIIGGMLLLQTHAAVAALSFGRGMPTTVGCVRYANSPDSVTITAALTAPGTITGGLAIPANRIQYDLINCDTGPMFSWTIFYDPAVGPQIIGAYTPLGFVDFTGAIVPQGGFAYTTLFNAGFGIYTYNTGAPWTIDYEPDHITFTATGANGLPANAGVGYLNPTHYLPSFAILYDPNLGNGLVPASAKIGSLTMNGQVYGPVLGNPCLSITCANITVETCAPCTNVLYNAVATDKCCDPASVTLVYNPPVTYCFPKGSTTPVQVIAYDACGNVATNYFTVTVNPSTNCGPPTNCISINASNIVAYTCNPCTPVSYKVNVTDQCCPAGGVTVVYNPPETTCFPLNSATPVQVVAWDQCGNTNTASFTVTVLPGVNCNPTPTNCISIDASNIVVHTCEPCIPVPYTATASDQCCPLAPPGLIYSIPPGFCFPKGSTTPVQVTAFDECGHTNTTTFTVTVLPGTDCGPTNCISIYATNVTAYTCNSCTTVPISAFAVDTCCAGSNPTLIYSLPATYCYPLNSTTPVQITAFDDCGHTNTVFILVTVLPAAGCAGTSPLSISGLTGPSPGGTNYITVWWPAGKAQLMQSSNLFEWNAIPGITNPPYVAPMQAPMKFYRLLYN